MSRASSSSSSGVSGPSVAGRPACGRRSNPSSRARMASRASAAGLPERLGNRHSARGSLLRGQRLIEHPRQPHPRLIQPPFRHGEAPRLIVISQLGAWLHPLPRRRVLVGFLGRQQGFRSPNPQRSQPEPSGGLLACPRRSDRRASALPQGQIGEVAGYVTGKASLSLDQQRLGLPKPSRQSPDRK